MEFSLYRKKGHRLDILVGNLVSILAGKYRLRILDRLCCLLLERGTSRHDRSERRLRLPLYTFPHEQLIGKHPGLL